MTTDSESLSSAVAAEHARSEWRPDVGRVPGQDGESGSSARPVVAVASRPPVVRAEGGWRVAPGGLAPIVRRALESRGGVWVSWNGADDPPPRRIDGVDFEVLTLSLGRRDATGFYAGYSNRTLWPLFHDQVVTPVFDTTWWDSYRSANATFARAAMLAMSRLEREATIWVHDYHLMLVPERLRTLGVGAPLAFFLHTPFPSPAVFARLPQRCEVLEGLGRADVVGFHTRNDRDRFTAAWTEFGGAGPPPPTVVAPASIDADAFRAVAADPTIRHRAKALRARLGDRVLLLGIERLDYTKGIPERLRALEVLFARRPDLRRRVVYVQIAHPSRERLPEYRQLRATVEREIGRLNGRFTGASDAVTFRYLHRGVRDRELAAYYVAADVALVTPLRDGMNLVAKEFVVAQHAAGGHGALVLSEFAGAADELSEAIVCNPYDPVGTADAIELAIEMDDDARRQRLESMAKRVADHDVELWAERQLRAAERGREVEAPLHVVRAG